jgi:hypothetical protein
MSRSQRRNKAIAPYGSPSGKVFATSTAQGLLDCPVKPGNDNVRETAIEAPLTRRPGMTRNYPATVLHVFARFSAPRSDRAKIV